MSLQLGKELFDITQTVDTSGAVPRQAIGGTTQPPVQASQPASQSQSQTSGVKAHGLTYLVAQHKRAEILQCESLITGTMTLRPTGMQSETHRMLVRAVGQKHSKVARLRMAPDPTTDPEREKMELLKQAAKKPRKSKGGDDEGLGGGRRRRPTYTRKRHGDDMWSDDDEDDAIFGIGSEDEFGTSGSAARKGKKKEEENTRRGPGEYQNDDFLVADSEDEDADFVGSDDDGGKKNKRKWNKGGDAEEDDLDRLEAKIEAEEKKRKQQEASEPSNDNAGKGTTEEAMDIESEEDDEDWGVRRAGTGSRKRRAIEFDDEEDE